MRHVSFDPRGISDPKRLWWSQWTARAQQATAQVVADYFKGQKLEFNSEIWGDLKAFLLENVFYGKCAYCEARITHTSFGDAEHYRPKGRVTVRRNGSDEIVQSGSNPHPGYFWLAYDWENLLPACQRCNSAEGKMNQFPVARQHADVTDPPLDSSSLDILESPLLLHPYRDDPRHHLVFGKKGVVSAKGGSQRGQTSITVYSLDRDTLAVDRQAAQEFGWLRFLLALGNGGSVDDVLASYRSGEEPHSAAVLDYIFLMWDEIRSTL